MANYNIAYLIELKDKYTAVAKKVASANQHLKESFKGMNKSMSNFSDNLGKVKKKFDSIQQVGRGAFMGVTLPIAGLIGSVVKLGAKLEDTRMVFTTMLGDANKANKLVADIQKMASLTPFGTQELLDASKLMLNFGVATEDIMGNLEMLGNIAGGDKQRFQSLSLAFSQISSQGRLTGQDLLQMVNAGFNPLQIMSEKTGRSMGELKDAMSKGAISFAMVQQAMRIATSEGGRFHNLMAKQSTTMNGLMSTLIDNFELAGATIGEKMLPYIKPLVSLLITLTNSLANLDPKVMAVLFAIAGVIAVIPVLVMAIGFIGSSIMSTIQAFVMLGQGIVMAIGFLAKLQLFTKIATAIQWLFNTSLLGCPIFWLIAGLIAIIAVIVLLAKNWDWVTQKVGEFGAWSIKCLTNIWNAVVNVFTNVKNFIQNNFINILLLALGPIGLVIKGIMKIKDLMGQIGSENINVEGQIKSTDVANRSKVDINGNIDVTASGGAKVNKVSSKTTSTGKGKVGYNISHK